MNTESKKREQD